MPKRLACLLLLLLAATASNAQQIAITMDDLPEHGPLPPGVTRMQVTEDLLKAFKDAHLPPVYGFVNAERLERHPDETAVLDAWRAAGNPLGNHTWTHYNLNGDHTVEAFEQEVTRNEAAISSRMAGTVGEHDWHWLRFPNLAEGDTPEKRAAARSFLATQGYRIAGVTMSYADYSYNEPYARCMAKGDTAAVAQLETALLHAVRDEADFRRAEAKAALGHDIPYVLLTHIGAFDARIFPRVLALYREMGFTFVSLQQAEHDPFYANDLDLKLPSMPDTLDEAMKQKGLPIPPKPKPEVDLQTICK